jgi:hypothetical protein
VGSHRRIACHLLRMCELGDATARQYAVRGRRPGALAAVVGRADGSSPSSPQPSSGSRGCALHYMNEIIKSKNAMGHGPAHIAELRKYARLAASFEFGVCASRGRTPTTSNQQTKIGDPRGGRAGSDAKNGPKKSAGGWVGLGFST